MTHDNCAFSDLSISARTENVWINAISCPKATNTQLRAHSSRHATLTILSSFHITNLSFCFLLHFIPHVFSISSLVYSLTPFFLEPSHFPHRPIAIVLHIFFSPLTCVWSSYICIRVIVKE